jgi:tetratricopeptide (TPR) repeat protein
MMMFEFDENQTLDVGVLMPQDVSTRLLELQADSSATAGAFVDCGNGFRSFGLFYPAIAAYSEATERDPRSADAFLGRAQAAFGLALLQDSESEREVFCSKSIADYKRVLELKGQSREAVLGLGSALLAANRFAECESWIADTLAIASDRNLKGDLLYTLALCRLFAGDLDQALDHADNMERVAGFDIEHSFICGLVSSLRGENEKMLEYEIGIRRKDEKLSQVLRAIAVGARCGTFSELARLLV